PRNTRDGDRAEPPLSDRAPEEIRFRGTGTRPIDRRRARAPGLPSGSLSERRCDRGGNRVSQEAAVHARTADPALLLPGTAKPARPAPFSPRVDRGEDGVGGVAAHRNSN